MRAIRLLLPMCGVLLLGVAGAQQPTRKPAPQPTVKPVATVKQIMEAMTIPASDALFDAGAEAPTDEKGWAAVRTSAIIVAESGNLLMIGSRVKDRGAWMKMSRAMVDAGLVALKAAEAKSVGGLLDAGDQILASCESCHERYLDKKPKHEGSHAR